MRCSYTARVGLVLLLLFSLNCCALAASGISNAARATIHTPLRIGDRGQRVRDLQWLLAGNTPSVYRKSVHPYRRGKIDGVYGHRTANAVSWTKWRLGYPLPSINGSAGPRLFRLLLGREARPLTWIARASARLKNQHQRARACGLRAVRDAARELGVHEIPWGSNDGPRVRVYQSVTGAYRAAWCVSFSQFVYRESLIGTFANRSAGVFYSEGWFHQNGWLRARPKTGAVVMFLRWQGHMGIVSAVTTRGFYFIAGNDGNAVSAHFVPNGWRATLFAYPPCLR